MTTMDQTPRNTIDVVCIEGNEKKMAHQDSLIPTTAGSSYYQDDLVHECDYASPLFHGTLRYVPAPYLSVEVKNSFPVKNDRNYVYVPAGYVNREADFVKKILNALGLATPNLVIVTTATEGSQEEQMEKYVIEEDIASSSPLSDAELKKVLRHKINQMLDSLVESCKEMGAWVMPDDPRRRNSIAQMICKEAPIAVGVIGLDDNDEEEGFKECLKTSMQPIGSPAKKVASLQYDPDVRDGAPCFELTHLLIFENPYEMDIFKRSLLDVVPDMLLVLGSITHASTQLVYDYAVEGNPIVLFRHTGEKINNLCKMFQHVEKEMCRMKDEDNSSGGKGMEISRRGMDYSRRGMDLSRRGMDLSRRGMDLSRRGMDISCRTEVSDTIRIPPMFEMDDELINLFVNTWPADFESDTVILADPIKLNGPKFQRLMLDVITASFDLRRGNKDLQKARKEVLDYAWSFHSITKRHALHKQQAAEFLNNQLVFCTLFSIVISVLYDQAYGPGGGSKNTFQLIAFVLTILLPLYITSLKRESESNNPTVRWTAFKQATAKLESEIYKMRAQVGPYRPLDKSQEEMRKPMVNFVEKTRYIWSKIQEYLKDDGMDISDGFYDKTQHEEQGADFSELLVGGAKGVAFGVANCIDGTMKKLSKAIDSGMHDEYEELPSSESKLSDDQDIETPVAFVGETTLIIPKEEDREFNEPKEPASPLDDPYSPINAEQYLQMRLYKQMRIKSEELVMITKRNRRISGVTQAVTIFSGATAALSLQWMVPIVLGLMAAVGSGQVFYRYAERIERINSMIVELNELELWWMGLSMYQQQLPHNKDRLIIGTEDIIISEIVGR